MHTPWMTRLVVGLGVLALAGPAAAQSLGVGGAASATHVGGMAVADHGGGWVAFDRPLSPHVSLGGSLGLVSGARTYWESQARTYVRFTGGDGPVRPYAQYSVGLGRRHTTTAAEALTSTVGYAGPGGGLLFTIGTTPWSLITGVDLSGPRLGGFTATEDLRVTVGFVRSLR